MLPKARYFSGCNFNDLKTAVQPQKVRKTVFEKKFLLASFTGHYEGTLEKRRG